MNKIRTKSINLKLKFIFKILGWIVLVVYFYNFITKEADFIQSIKNNPISFIIFLLAFTLVFFGLSKFFQKILK